MMRVCVACVALVLALGCGNEQTPTSASPSVAASPTPTTAEKTFTAADLPYIALTSQQMAGWQTATRTDLTGPFTSTTNTNQGETPRPLSTLVAGYRQTIGNPGGSGVNTVRTILEIFDSAATARAAIGTTVSGYEAIGYSQSVDISKLSLGAEAVAR